MEKKENSCIKEEATQESNKLIIKEKIKKYKKEIFVGGSVLTLVSTNFIIYKVTGNIAFSKGLSKGINKGFDNGVAHVMNNPSLLGKALNSCKNRTK